MQKDLVPCVGMKRYAPFARLLKALKNKEAYVTWISGERMRGTIEITEDDLLYMVVRDIGYISKLNIESIAFDSESLKLRKGNQKSKNPFWKWLKGLEGKDIRVKTENLREVGQLVKVDADLCFLNYRGETTAIAIDYIQEISADKKLFNLKTVVEFEEIE